MMGKHERLSRLGLWPRCLGADLAALYCGVTKTTFYARVDAGKYPKPFQNGALVQWDRGDLDDAIEAMKQRSETASQESPQEPVADTLGEALAGWTPGSSAAS